MGGVCLVLFIFYVIWEKIDLWFFAREQRSRDIQSSYDAIKKMYGENKED